MPKRRSVLGLALVSTLVLLSGCAQKTAQDKAVDSAARRYGRVVTGMSKQEVVTSLGTPSSQKDNIYRWETIASPQNHASIDVHFDRTDKVTSVAKTRAGAN
jgi:hypothetical protein